MSTALSDVYKAFLARIETDDWDGMRNRPELMEEDWELILNAAIPEFRFPRVNLEHDGFSFVEELSSQEIQIIATHMKCVWLNRNILKWENVKPLYDERDYSQGNYIGKLTTLLEKELINAEKYESKYYRSINNKPYQYRNLAGGS